MNIRLPTLDIPGAEFMYEAAHTALDTPWREYLTDDERADGTEPAPGLLYQRAYVDTVRSYAMNTELAEHMLFALLSNLPHSAKTPGKGLDAVMGLVTLLHTREAVQTLLVQDIAEDKMLDEARKQPQTPTFDEGGKTRRELDAEISRSAEMDKQITDREIGDIAFGGNKDKIDDNIRHSAHRDPDREKPTFEGVKESNEYKGPIKLPKIPPLHMFDARDCFRATTAWTAGGAVALATGEREPLHYPRLRALYAIGLEEQFVRRLIASIINGNAKLRAPERERPDDML